MNEFLKSLVFYFINHVLNKLPSRKLRMFFYHYMSGKKISKSASIGLGVKILDIRGIEIGEHSNVNFESILDGRGEGVVIGKNVDIAPQVNIWSLGHNPKSAAHEALSSKVVIEEGSWLANRVIVLPGTNLKRNTVVAAGAIVHGVYEESQLLRSEKAKVSGNTFSENREKLASIRLFR